MHFNNLDLKAFIGTKL